MDNQENNLRKSTGFDLSTFFNGIDKINQHFIQSYFKNRSGYEHDNQDIIKTYSSFIERLLTHPKENFKVQNFQFEFLQKKQALWASIFINPYLVSKSAEPIIVPKKGDKRFNAPHWSKYPLFDFFKQNHLLFEELTLRIVDEVEMGEPIRKRLDFYTRQYADLFSPANCLFTNPEAIELAMQTKGESLWQGFENYVKDIEKGSITQVDESAFEVGKNLAITPGAVIYENELIQLIQYTPSTKEVSEIPLLIIPPWINKYYILDLQPENSFVKFMVEKGFTVFIISWKNPSPGMGYLTFDDYVDKGALTAIKVAKNISGAETINTLGYCLGGTLLSIASSILATRKENTLNTITFLSSMIDFTDIGPMGDVIDGALVNKLERSELLKDGVMHGHNMETAFNLIRAKDMIWNYAVNSYLKGLPPPVFDIMYWTNDNTNLPARMYIYYMKEMIFKNRLAQKNALNICDTPIDIGKIVAPVFVIAMEKDYISPPQTVFTGTGLVSGPVEFILGESGHVMGVANPPSRKKYGYFLDGKLNKGYDEWKKTAKFTEGSWWTVWSDKLKEKSGKLIPAPKSNGNKTFLVIEPAPGSYVKEKGAAIFANPPLKKEQPNKQIGYSGKRVSKIETQDTIETPDTKSKNKLIIKE
jgi:polyhydroxyalkanoate synthase